MEQTRRESSRSVLGLKCDRDALPGDAAIGSREDSADVAARASVKVADQPASVRVGEVNIAEAKIVVRRFNRQPDQFLDALDFSPLRAAVSRLHQSPVSAYCPSVFGV